MVIEVRHIITNVCKANQLRNVNTILCGQTNVTIQKMKKLTITREKIVTFAINTRVEYTLKNRYV